MPIKYPFRYCSVISATSGDTLERLAPSNPQTGPAAVKTASMITREIPAAPARAEEYPAPNSSMSPRPRAAAAETWAPQEIIRIQALTTMIIGETRPYALMASTPRNLLITTLSISRHSMDEIDARICGPVIFR